MSKKRKRHPEPQMGPTQYPSDFGLEYFPAGATIEIYRGEIDAVVLPDGTRVIRKVGVIG